MKIEEAYETLGLEQGSSEEEVRRAYKKAALKYHPGSKETRN
jgi:DnaJ-class molecular chaperone